MTWDEIKGLVCVDFLAWLDRTCRCDTIAAVERMGGWYRGGDLDASWQELALYVFNQAATAERWNDRQHLTSWCVWFVRKSVVNQRRRGSQSYRHARARLAYARTFSELTEAELASLQARPVAERETTPDQLGPSTGWLSKALDDLTPRRRRAIDLCVLGDLTVNQAAEIDGCTKNAMNKARHLALAGLRFAAEGKAYRTEGGYVVEEAGAA